MTRLNDTLPEGLKILSGGAPVFDAKEIEKAQYFVKIVFETNEEASLFAEKADELLKGEELMAEKPGKKGHRKIMKQVNLIDMIFDAKITSADNIVNLQCVLAAGNTHNLNPTLLVETIENCVALRHTQLHIVRKRLITKNNKNFR